MEISGKRMMVTGGVKPEKDLGYKWTIGLEQGMKSLIEWRQTKSFFS